MIALNTSFKAIKPAIYRKCSTVKQLLYPKGSISASSLIVFLALFQCALVAKGVLGFAADVRPVLPRRAVGLPD